MEKVLKSTSIEIAVKSREGFRVFEINNPKPLNKMLLNEIKKDFFLMDKNSVVIYPEQKFIESQKMYIEDKSRII